MDHILNERRLRWLGLVIRMDHQRIPRQSLHWGVPRGSGEVQVVHVQTGGAQSTRICCGWESPQRKQRWQLKTYQNGIGVWPNASTTDVVLRTVLNLEDSSRTKSCGLGLDLEKVWPWP